MNTPTPPAPDAPPVGVPLTDGWIEWHGGENPVPKQMVEFRLRGEMTARAGMSGELDWRNNGHADLVAYRPVPAPSAAAGGGERERAARAVYAARPARMLHPEERALSWEEAQEDCPDRVATIYRDVDAILAALQPAPADPVAGVGEVSYTLVRKIGRLGHPADDDYSYSDDDDAERDVLNGLIAEAREIMASPSTAALAPSPDDGIVAKLVGALEEIADESSPLDHVNAPLQVRMAKDLVRRQNIARQALASARQSGGV